MKQIVWELLLVLLLASGITGCDDNHKDSIPSTWSTPPVGGPQRVAPVAAQRAPNKAPSTRH